MSNAWNGKIPLILGGVILVVAVGVGIFVAGKAADPGEMQIDYATAELARKAAEEVSGTEHNFSAQDLAAAEASTAAAVEAFEADAVMNRARGVEESGSN